MFLNFFWFQINFEKEKLWQLRFNLRPTPWRYVKQFEDLNLYFQICYCGCDVISCLLFILNVHSASTNTYYSYYIYSILASNQTSCYSFIIEVLFQAIARLRCDQGDDEWSTAQRILQIHNGIYYVWWALALSRAWTISSSTFAPIEDRSELDSQINYFRSSFLH